MVIIKFQVCYWNPTTKMANPPVKAVSKSQPKTPPPPILPKPGDYVASGYYRVLKKIGGGSFGDIFQAMNVETGLVRIILQYYKPDL